MNGTYKHLGSEIGEIVDHKNAAYGSSFAKAGDFLRLLYPNGLTPDQMEDALLLVRIFDKQMRIATNKDAFGESPFEDIAGYGLLGAKRRKEKQQRCQGSVSDQDVISPSKAMPDSAAQLTKEPTTTNASAPAEPPPSPPPASSSPQLTDVLVSTAVANVSGSGEDRESFRSFVRPNCSLCCWFSTGCYLAIFAFLQARRFGMAQMIAAPITPAQMRRLQILYGQFERHTLDCPGAARQDRLQWASTACGRVIDSFKGLTLEEGRRLIDGLQKTLGVKAPSKSPRRKQTPPRRREEGDRRPPRSDPPRHHPGRPQRVRTLIRRDLDRLGWDQARLEAFLASPRGPNKRSTVIRTLGDANRVHWALKHMKPSGEHQQAS